MSHIPQPPVEAGAPGEQIESTDSAPMQQNLEVSMPSNSQEITPAVGEFNLIDPYFYTQNCQIATVTWTTSDQIGKLLWYIPISPQLMHKNLVYITRMYLAWTGDFEFMYKIAGTGFHAGMLTLVKLPPGVHPSKITNYRDFSTQPWEGSDAKMLGATSYYGRDIRPIKYHYVHPQPGTPEDYNIGGYIALYVNLPLSTSASGVPRVDVGIWVKCAPNFRVGWVIPYDLYQDTSEAVMPETLKNALDWTGTAIAPIMSANALVAHYLKILPAATKVINTGIYQCFSMQGDILSKFYSNQGDEVVNQGTWNVSSVSEDGKTMVLVDPSHPWQASPQLGLIYAGTRNIVTPYIKSVDEVHADGKLVRTFTADEGHSFKGIVPGDFLFVTYFHPDTTKATWTVSGWTDNEISSPLANESFVVYANNDVMSLQITELTRLFRNGALKDWLPIGSAALLTIYDSANNLPLRNVKLYRKGFMTTNAMADAAQFNINTVYFQYNGLISETGNIPTSQTMSRDFLLVMDQQRRLRKAEKKRATSAKLSARQKH